MSGASPGRASGSADTVRLSRIDSGRDEVATGRDTELRPSVSQAFLLGLLSSLPSVRVLQFACGPGRLLRELARLPNVEAHGVDTDEALVGAARASSAEPAAAARIQVIPSGGGLPFADGSFDVVFTSDLLSEVAPVDVPAILRDLYRVSRAVVVHLEEPADAGATRWRHDLRAMYAEVTPVSPRTLDDDAERRRVFWLVKPGSDLQLGGDRSADAALEAKLQQQAKELRETAAQLASSMKSEASLRARLDALEQSPAMELARRLDVNAATGMLSRTLQAAARVTAQVRSLRTSPAEPDVALPFGGFAVRASHPTPAALEAAQPRVVAVCHPDWRGIHAATYGLCDHVLEIDRIRSADHADQVRIFLARCGAERLVIHGVIPGTEILTHLVTQHAPEVRVSVVFHGTPAQAHPGEHALLDHLCRLVDEGAVRKLGFVKAGLAEYFRSLGYPAEHVMNFLRDPVVPPRAAADPEGRFHVGVFGSSVSHKNVVTQVMAAQMVPGVVTHTCEPVDAPFLYRSPRKVETHGLLPRDRFLALLRKMHATLYVSLSECYPMTVLESIAAGTLCLTSHTSRLFDGAPELFDALVVSEHDNPRAIASQLSAALERRVELVTLAQQHLARLNTEAARRWREFLA